MVPMRGFLHSAAYATPPTGGGGQHHIVLRDLADLVWPCACPGCGATGAASVPACADCLAVLTAVPLPTSPRPRPPGLPPLWAVTAYDGVARALVLAHKEHGARSLGRPLGGALGTALAAAVDAALGTAGGWVREPWVAGPCAVVPVPSSRAARRARGDDPTLRLSRVAVGVLRRRGIPAVLVPALRQGRKVADQAGLSAEDRAANLRGALDVVPAARPALAAAALIVVADDVVTTGATLVEAARALSCAGAVGGAAAVAATQRRYG